MGPKADPTDLADLARRLHASASDANQRRGLVLHGDREATAQAAGTVLDALSTDAGACTTVSDRDLGLPGRTVPIDRADALLGTTQRLAILDAHDRLVPNVLGRTIGTVDGGGLLVLLAPPLDAWPDRADGFDEHLAVPPFGADDVGGRFRERLVGCLRGREGVAIVDVDGGTVEDDGRLASQLPAPDERPVEVPAHASFPGAAYRACRTGDQARALEALEALLDPDAAVVVEADRGRGKSSAAGLAAGSLAARGLDVLVTARRFDNAREVLERARELVETLGATEDARIQENARRLATDAGGRVRFERPAAALDAIAGDPPDAVLVDEAAGLPVHVLADVLDAPCPVAFVTTIHGYEGAGRGFSVRFRDRLDESPRTLHEVSMAQPIRYARDDPLEALSFDALALDAEPADDPVVEDARPERATYQAVPAEDLAADEQRLRELFGLLVLAHYRTSPNDLARLLDAPNLAVRALAHEGHVVSVALVAREGGLDEATRRASYEGTERVRGHLIPDVLTSQLRDEDAGRPIGWRVMRIATHPAVRSRGLGSLLLARVWEEADVDWLGTSYGATPELLRFWSDNGYETVHLSTSRNPASGERSAVMLDPLTDEGRALAERSSRWMLERIPSVLADALSDADPDVVRATLASIAGPVEVDLTDREARLVAAAAHGPAMYDTNPRPFRELALAHLVDRRVDLEARAERLLVAKVLQARSWEAVVDELGYEARREAMLALGETYRPLVEAYGGPAASEEAGRYR